MARVTVHRLPPAYAPPPPIVRVDISLSRIEAQALRAILLRVGGSVLQPLSDQLGLLGIEEYS
jgi:hypothetical protein